MAHSFIHSLTPPPETVTCPWRVAAPLPPPAALFNHVCCSPWKKRKRKEEPSQREAKSPSSPDTQDAPALPRARRRFLLMFVRNKRPPALGFRPFAVIQMVAANHQKTCVPFSFFNTLSLSTKSSLGLKWPVSASVIYHHCWSQAGCHALYHKAL